jgi:tRNA(Ile)-lysidine synthase
MRGKIQPMSDLLTKVNWPQPSKYIVAVSGGVDSITLLDLLAKRGSYDLVVAHFDHGMRPGSSVDADFVQQVADELGLPCVMQRAELDNVSEATARTARYKFLQQVTQSHAAKAMITAHHLDDRLETSIFNLRRGSNRYGFTSLNSTPQIVRPLLQVTRDQIVNYALSHKLSWREDPTNLDQTKSRNYIRHTLIPTMNKVAPGWQRDYLQRVESTQQLNPQIDRLLAQFVEAGDQITVSRRAWAELDDLTRRQLLAFVARRLGVVLRPSQTRLLCRELAQAKTGSSYDLPDRLKVWVDANQMTFGYVQSVSSPEPPLVPPGYRVRQWQPGDRIRLKVGTKKLQDLFVDAKIERSRRQIWPVVVNAGDEVVWVPQLTRSPF